MNFRKGTHPLVLLGLAFAIQMCSSPQNGPGPDGGAAFDGGGLPDGKAVGEACTTVTDCTPPASQCKGSNALVYWYATSCTGGRCQFASQTSSCYSVCSNGGCYQGGTTGGYVGTDCVTSADCTPQPSQCLDASTLAYDVPSCESGVCVHLQQTQSCTCVSNGCYTGGTAGGVGGWTGGDAATDAPGDALDDAPSDAVGDALQE